MKNNFRVLLYSHTKSRDLGVCYVIAKILERMGCESFVASTHNCASKTVRLWRPHAIFYTTLNATINLKTIYPKAKLFFCSGEGSNNYAQDQEEYLLANNSEIFNSISRIYLWGRRQKKFILAHIKDHKENSFLYGKEYLIDEKCLIVGHPRLSLIKYANSMNNDKKKVRIGFMGSFAKINFIDATRGPLYMVLQGRENDSELLSFQIALIKLYRDIISKLGVDRYSFSIRPYPLENMECYYKTKLVKDGVLEMDDSVDFGVWLKKIDLLIGPTTSTISQIAAAKIPFINLDFLCKRSSSEYMGTTIKDFLEDLENHFPKSDDELYYKIDNYKDCIISDAKLLEKFDDVYSINNNYPALLSISDDMMSVLQQEIHKINRSFPIKLFSFINAAKLKFLIKNSITYSYFNYKDMSPQLIKQLDPIVANILSKAKNGKIKA